MSKRFPIAILVGVALMLVVAAIVTWTQSNALDTLFGRRTAEPATTADQSANHAMPAAVPPPSSTARGEVVLDSRRQQLIGVRTTTVQRVSITPEIRAVGLVRYDETRQAEISTKVDGWIRELQADYTGKPVRRGDPLFTLYSPELVTTQNEYLLALRGHARSAGAQVLEADDYSERLLQAARERLLRWDFTSADIQELEKRGRATDTITFRSPVTGVILEKAAVQGMRVMAGQTLFRVTDVSTVWVEANVYAQDLPLVRIGQSASVSIDAYPGENGIARVTYIYPSVDEKTRTGKVRFEFASRGGRLKPGMYATVQLTGPAKSGLTIPADALLDTGKEQLVFVAQGDGYFEPRPVTAGNRTGDDVEIVEGLKEGDEVATGATFFLDSESQLRAAVQSYRPTPPQPDAAPSGPRQQLDITFRAQPDPPRTGENTLEVSVKDATGQPIADAEVTVTFFMPAMPTMNMPAMRNQSKVPPAGGGVYRGPGQIVMAGRWDVTVDVTRGGERLGSRKFALVAK